jgi:nucleoside-diphosphate-sugar epimerase
MQVWKPVVLVMIFITGANGRLGREVLKRIPKAIPLVRKPSGLKNEVVTNFEIHELKKILKNAKFVIHLAGSMNFLNPTELWASNVELTRNIVEALPQKCRIIFASSVSVYGKFLRELPADECSPLNPDSPYAKSKAEAEEIVKKHNNHVILRIATMYGKGFDDYYEILRQIKKGSMHIIGDGQNRIPFVHVEDVADAIKYSLKAKKGVYVIAGDGEKQEEILHMAASILNVPPPTGRIPLDAALMFAAFEEKKALLMGVKPKLTTEHVLILASDRVFDCSKAKKELKFKPRPIVDGIKEIVEDGIARGLF